MLKSEGTLEFPRCVMYEFPIQELERPRAFRHYHGCVVKHSTFWRISSFLWAYSSFGWSFDKKADAIRFENAKFLSSRSRCLWHYSHALLPLTPRINLPIYVIVALTAIMATKNIAEGSPAENPYSSVWTMNVCCIILGILGILWVLQNYLAHRAFSSGGFRATITTSVGCA